MAPLIGPTRPWNWQYLNDKAQARAEAFEICEKYHCTNPEPVILVAPNAQNLKKFKTEHKMTKKKARIMKMREDWGYVGVSGPLLTKAAMVWALFCYV